MTSTKFFRRTQLMYDLAFTFVCSLTAVAFSQVVRYGFSEMGFAWLCVTSLCVALSIVPPIRLRWMVRQSAKRVAPSELYVRTRTGEGGDHFVLSPANLTYLRNLLDALRDVDWQELERTFSESNLSLIRRYIRFRRRSAASRSLQDLTMFSARERAVADAVSLLLAPVLRAQGAQWAKALRAKRKYPLAFTAVAAKVAATAFVYRDLLSENEFKTLYTDFFDAVEQQCRTHVGSAA